MKIYLNNNYRNAVKVKITCCFYLWVTIGCNDQSETNDKS